MSRTPTGTASRFQPRQFRELICIEIDEFLATF